MILFFKGENNLFRYSFSHLGYSGCWYHYATLNLYQITHWWKFRLTRFLNMQFTSWNKSQIRNKMCCIYSQIYYQDYKIMLTFRFVRNVDHGISNFHVSTEKSSVKELRKTSICKLISRIHTTIQWHKKKLILFFEFMFARFKIGDTRQHNSFAFYICFPGVDN